MRSAPRLALSSGLCLLLLLARLDCGAADTGAGSLGGWIRRRLSTAAAGSSAAAARRPPPPLRRRRSVAAARRAPPPRLRRPARGGSGMQPSPPSPQPSPQQQQQTSPPPPPLPSPAPPGPQWELLWSDEFDGASLNGSKWEAMLGDGSSYGIPGWGNNELQAYTGRSENVWLEGGQLVIQAQAEPQGSPLGKYTSARLRTAGRFSVAPSPAHPVLRIEARMKLPPGDGMWPAFWMLPEDWAYGDWPASGEIDIMEGKNAMDWCLGSAHFGGVGALSTKNGGTAMAPADGWHVFGLEWEAQQLRWYLDGAQYLAANNAAGGQQGGWYSLGAGPDHPNAPFDQLFHLLLNLAVGGNFPWVSAEAVAATLASGPKRMLVDWVRVYGRAA